MDRHVCRVDHWIDRLINDLLVVSVSVSSRVNTNLTRDLQMINPLCKVD